MLWRFAATRADSETAERRAQQLIAITFWLLAAYVTVDATIALVSGDHPASSPVGIGLAIVTLIAMPLLANAKASVASKLDSHAGHSESRQNMLCAYLSATLLIGLTLNAVLGWWWADPITALVIAAVAAREGRESWRGESCCTTDGCC